MKIYENGAIMNKKFKDDYYRMTGKKWGGGKSHFRGVTSL